jgi:acid phosphatase class B
MTNMRRAKAPARKRARRPARADIRSSVFLLADEMDIPLRRASQIVFLMEMIDTRQGDEAQAIAFVAGEVRDKLDQVSSALAKLFRLAEGKRVRAR